MRYKLPFDMQRGIRMEPGLCCVHLYGHDYHLTQQEYLVFDQLLQSALACFGRGTPVRALSRGELFVLEEDGAVGAAALINQSQVDVYEGAPWAFPARAEEVCVMHTLVVSPAAAGRGCGQRFMAFYEEYARQNGWPELRIDTNARNLRARALYRKLGYREIGIVPATFNGIPGVELVLLEKHLKEERR